MDKFLVEDCCVGEITSLDVQLVQSGLSPDWFLDHIEVQEWESEGRAACHVSSMINHVAVLLLCREAPAVPMCPVDTCK